MLGYDAGRKLVQLNQAVKENIRIYLSQYRVLTDAINLKDAYIINIGVRFSIVVRRGFNKNEVLFRAIQAVKKHFDIKKWQIINSKNLWFCHSTMILRRLLPRQQKRS